MFFSILKIAIIGFLAIILLKVVGLWLYDWSLHWRWLHRYRLRKLRKKLPTWDTYEIYRSRCEFGCFALVEPCMTLKARSSYHALKRYLNKYELMEQEVHPMKFQRTPYETTYMWGKVKVRNTRTGYKIYYK